MNSSILIVGHPNPKTVEFGADFTDTFQKAITELNENKYPVVVASAALVGDRFEFLKSVRELTPDTQTVLVGSGLSPVELQKIINAIGVFKVIPEFEEIGRAHV